MAQINSVYDPDADEKAAPRTPGDRQTTPAGRSSDPRSEYDAQKSPKGDSSDPRGDLRSAEGGDLYNPQDTTTGSAGGKEDLKDAEESPASDGLYNDNGEGQGSRLRRIISKNKKKTAILGSIGVGVAGGGLGIFFMLIPLKVESLVTDLQNRAFSSSENAVGEETQNLFERYITTKVLPSYKSCGTTISRSCTPKDFGTGPVEGLYKTWSNARLENKLAEDYGLEFKYESSSGSWRINYPGGESGGTDIGKDGAKLDQVIDSRSDARKTVKLAMADSLQNETRWKKVMYHYKVGRLLESKYGIKRCIVFCGSRDSLHDKVATKKIAAKLKITQRVITPRSQTFGIVLECLLNPSCNPEDTQPTSADGDTASTAGEPENADTDGKIRTSLDQLATQYGASNLEDLKAAYSKISDDGYQKYFLSQALDKVGLSDVSDQVTDAVPIIGWISKTAGVINGVNRAGPVIKKLGYAVNSAAAVQLYSMFRTYADEIHTGGVDPTEVGSFNGALGSGNQGAANDPIVGGTAGAEQTPLYQNWINGKNSGGVASLENVLSPKAYAASTSDNSDNNNSSYVCSDGKPPSGTVCSEEVFGQGNAILNSLSDFTNLPGVNIITSAAGQISTVTSFIGGIFGTIFAHIPGVSDVSDLIANAINPVMESVVNKLIPNPFSTNMSGGRTFDMMAAGADVSGNDYAHTGLGGQVITPQQTADIINQQQEKAKQTFSSQSVFAQMLSTDSRYSLVSSLAMAIPFGKQAMIQDGFSTIINPVGSLGHSFASIFSGKASAAASAQPDPFGVTQYGYPDGTIPKDPETYWDQHCSDNATNAYMKDNSWNEAAAATTDNNTGMPENNSGSNPTGDPASQGTNPCLLIKASVGSAGGYFDTSNLTQDDLADLNGSGGGGGGDSGGSGTPTPGIPDGGKLPFTTDTSHPAYPGVDQMLARVKSVAQPGASSSATAAFCASIDGCSGKCESAVEVGWLGHRGQYADPFGNTNPSGAPGPDSAWAAAVASGHAHPKDRNPPVGALLIYTIPGDQYGHITIYLGNNSVFSTDFDYQGSVGIQPASHIETASWANSYVGWMDPYFSGKVGT